MLNDIEAKEFSDKYIGEALTFIEVDDDGHYVYNTANTGVGGFSAVYANGNKLFEGIDYEASQLNVLGLPAIITIIKSDYYSSTITADYYCWKTGLSVEQIVSGLVALGGYTSNTDIRSVVWNTVVRNLIPFSTNFAIGFYKQNNNFIFNWFTNPSSWSSFNLRNDYTVRQSIFPAEFTINANIKYVKVSPSAGVARYFLGDEFYTDTYGNKAVLNGYGLSLYDNGYGSLFYINLLTYNQGILTSRSLYSGSYREIKGVQVKNNKVIFFDTNGIALCEENLFFDPKIEVYNSINSNNAVRLEITNLAFSQNTDNYIINNDAEKYSSPVIKSNISDKLADTGYWGGFLTELSENTVNYSLKYASSPDNITFTNLFATNINTNVGVENRYIYWVFEITNIAPLGSNLLNTYLTYYQNSLRLNLVNLSGKSVLEALQDLALISGYEFGVDRQGTFFFRPRSQSTTPIFDLDESEIVKIDNIKQNFNDFFTKLTLTFAQIPLEFYANEGTRPTSVDKYGIINKEIDKPDIVNYDNPELAQAIGPQLLEVYSDLSDVIQCTAKLNLSLELGDIVNLKRNYNLNTPDSATDYTKWQNQNTYFRACKITGINYNLSKRQMTYTLRDVSNENTRPQEEMYQFVYDFPIRLEPKY